MIYRMAPNFRGAQFLQNGLPQVSTKIIIVDQSLVTFIDMFIIIIKCLLLLSRYNNKHFNKGHN